MIQAHSKSLKHLLRVVKEDAFRKVGQMNLHPSSSKAYCYATLNEVSRSFAMVIQDLPIDVKDAICIFYLVLRALDSIEDDMHLNLEEKNALLLSFHEKCGDESFFLKNVGDKQVYQDLLENYPKVSQVFNSLDEAYQDVIKEITEDMARGMMIFANKPVQSKADFDEYCHYVAGLVGQGLSKIFVASKLENPSFLLKMDISNSMGLFLQKTNITRDYYEDIDEGRIFWPEEIWSSYVGNIADLKKEPLHPKSIACLNKMVENALQHLPDCMAYLHALNNPKIFRFCAIPQVMAIGTLSLLHNNPKALIENVKLDKATTIEVFTQMENMQDFAKFAMQFLQNFKVEETDIAMQVLLAGYQKDLQQYL